MLRHQRILGNFHIELSDFVLVVAARYFSSMNMAKRLAFVGANRHPGERSRPPQPRWQGPVTPHGQAQSVVQAGQALGAE